MRINHWVLIFVLLQGCSTLQKLRKPINPAPTALVESEIQIEHEDYKTAELNLRQYISDVGPDAWNARARIDLARARLGLGKTTEALQDLQILLQEKVGLDPAIVALCSYYSGIAFLKTGDDLKALASFLDAERLSSELPPEIAWAELPAHLSVIYRQQEDWNRAREYSQKAQSGVERIFIENPSNEKSLQNEFLGKKKKSALYFNIGSFAETSALGDPLKNLQGLEILQFYLLRAIELQDPTWSERAQQDLELSYRQIWNEIAQSNEAPTERLKSYVATIEKLKALSPSFNVPAREKETLEHLQVLQDRAHQMLLNQTGGPSLTAEAVERDGLRKDGTVRSEPFFPSEKKPFPKKTESQPQRPSSMDPNLERP